MWSKDTRDSPSIYASFTAVASVFGFFRRFLPDKSEDVVGAPVEAHVTGCLNLITFEGSFKALVRSGNVKIFETEAMNRAIEYKWQTYGFRCHTFTTVGTMMMVLFFLVALYFGGTDSEWDRIAHAICMGLSSMVSFYLLKKEFEERQADKQHYWNSRNVLDLVCLLNVWVLTALSLVVLFTHNDGEITREGVDLVQRPLNAICVLLMLAEMLACLGSYTVFGENTRLIYKVTSDSLSFLMIMFVFLFAYACILRALLYSGHVEEGIRSDDIDDRADLFRKDGFVSPFEQNGDHWTRYLQMFSFLFNFLFLGSWDDKFLESTINPGHQSNLQRDLMNMYSKLFFYVYGLFYLIVLLNLLIAIMGDSYDRVKDDEVANGRLARARALVDIDRIWGSSLQSDAYKKAKNYPHCLHFLAPRTAQSKEGRAKGLSNRIKQAQTEGFKKMADSLDKKFEALDKKIEELMGAVKQNKEKLEKRLENEEGHKNFGQAAGAIVGAIRTKT